MIVFRLMNWYLQESVIDTPLTYSIAHCTHWIMSGQYHSQEILNNEINEGRDTVWECDSREGKIKKKTTSVMCAIVYSRTYVCLFVHTYM